MTHLQSLYTCFMMSPNGWLSCICYDVMINPHLNLIWVYNYLLNYRILQSQYDICSEWAESAVNIVVSSELHTVWPEILAGNLFWRIGSFESNPLIFPSTKLFTVCQSYVLLRDIINMSSTVVQNVRTKASNFERMERK